MLCNLTARARTVAVDDIRNRTVEIHLHKEETFQNQSSDIWLLFKLHWEPQISTKPQQGCDEEEYQSGKRGYSHSHSYF